MRFTIKAGGDEVSFFVDDETVLDGIGSRSQGEASFSIGDCYRVDLVQRAQRADGSWLAQKASVLCPTHSQ